MNSGEVRATLARGKAGDHRALGKDDATVLRLRMLQSLECAEVAAPMKHRQCAERMLDSPARAAFAREVHWGLNA